MATTKGTGKVQRMLNHMNPAANAARLGDTIAALINQVNFLTAALQATSGVTGLVMTGAVTLPNIENPTAAPALGVSDAP